MILSDQSHSVSKKQISCQCRNQGPHRGETPESSGKQLPASKKRPLSHVTIRYGYFITGDWRGCANGNLHIHIARFQTNQIVTRHNGTKAKVCGTSVKRLYRKDFKRRSFCYTWNEWDKFSGKQGRLPVKKKGQPLMMRGITRRRWK